MHRQPLLAKILTYKETFPEEQDTAQRFYQFVADNVQCFERSLVPGHITASAWVVDAATARVLLVHHRKLAKWIQPGGHADGCANTLEAAVKEVNEETGLTEISPVGEDIFDLDIHTIPARKSDSEHQHYDVRYAFWAHNAQKLQQNCETLELRWVELDEISTLTTEESVLRMSRKWRGLP